METGIENEIVHDVASLLLEAEVLFAVVMAWIMAIFFSAMATRPSFTKWKKCVKRTFLAVRSLFYTVCYNCCCRILV